MDRRKALLAREEELMLRSAREELDSGVVLATLAGVVGRRLLPDHDRPQSSSSFASSSSSVSSNASVNSSPSQLSSLARVLSISSTHRSRLLLRSLHHWRRFSDYSLVSSKLLAASSLVSAALAAQSLVSEQSSLLDSLQSKLQRQAKVLIEQGVEVEKLTSEKAKVAAELQGRNGRIKDLERANHVLARQVKGLLAKGRGAAKAREDGEAGNGAAG